MGRRFGLGECRCWGNGLAEGKIDVPINEMDWTAVHTGNNDGAGRYKYFTRPLGVSGNGTSQ